MAVARSVLALITVLQTQDAPPPACCAACAGAGGYCAVSGLSCCCADVVVYLYSAIETCRAPLTCDATQLCPPPPPQVNIQVISSTENIADVCAG